MQLLCTKSLKIEAHLSGDSLENEDLVKALRQVLLEVSKDNPVQAWDMAKLQVKNAVQDFTQFRKKQHDAELASLRKLLHSIESRIYQGEELEGDRRQIQSRITDKVCNGN